MPLLNAFIDSIVCVGFNSQRGLIPDRQSEENVPPLLSYHQPYVLAILTGDQAAYPEVDGKFTIDSSYPFQTHSKYSSGYVPNNKFQKKQAVANTFVNLPIFCSPDGVKISLYEERPIHHIVFTQEEGKRSYAVVLTIPQKFILKSDKPDDDGNYQIEPMIRVAPQPTKPQSRKAPSAYRHTTTIINPLNAMPSYNSPNTARKQLQNSLSNLESQDQGGSSYDSSESNNSASPSSGASGSSSTGPRRRSTSNLSLTSKNLGRSNNSLAFDVTEPFYLPHFVVLISSHPYWSAMHEVISIINNEILQKKIEPSSDTYRLLIQKYAFFACNTPIPPIAWERFFLSFNLINDPSVITLDPPAHTNRSVLDLDLSILLLTLNSGKLIEVLAILLTQQAIIFFSKDYSRIVTNLECLLYLIYPLKWIHTYIPLVPHSLRDYCLEGPPGSYIMGVNSRYQSTVEELDFCFTCNLDDDTQIHIPSGLDLPRIPPNKLRRFIGPITDFLNGIKIQRSLQEIQKPIILHESQKREHERRHRLETNNKIIEIFLDLMVDLCDDTLKAIYWKVDRPKTSSSHRRTSNEKKNAAHNQGNFIREKYLLSKTEGAEREFYRLFINTTAFELFIEEERTATSSTEFRKICQLRSQHNQDQPHHSNTPSTDKQVSFFDCQSSSRTILSKNKSTVPLFDSTSNQMLLPLPSWPAATSTHYLDCCIDVFTNELENAQKEMSSPIISIYAYLRGCALLARGYLLEGLHDLYLIENVNLFPKDYIQTTILSLLSDASLFERFFQQSYYVKAPTWKKIEEESDGNKRASVCSNEFTLYPPNLTKEDIAFEQFCDYVQQSSIVDDRDTAIILFKALSQWIYRPTTTTATAKPARRWSLGGNTSKESSSNSKTVQKGGQTIAVTASSTIPTKIFEQFLEVWQRTSAEKARMYSCLPKDRQEQETVLMISTTDIISRKTGRGKLILTERALYLLPEGRSSALLIVEFLKIVMLDLHQHKAIFAASKPVVRIYAFHSVSPANLSPTNDTEPLDMLIFKDNLEQNLWYKIIFELWSGVSIAEEECDTAVTRKVSQHISLVDTLVNTDYSEVSNEKKSKAGNQQACLDAAMNEFSVFTQMRKTGSSKCITNETRHALDHRLSPSINENERCSVNCLIFTESTDTSYSSLWCAYGKKLKIFDTKTWICDPNELSFPSVIKCMCLDNSNKLWICCVDGQIFIVDIIQRIGGTQLASMDGKYRCQTMAFDSTRKFMLIANRSSLLMIWNTMNKQHLTNINLGEMFRGVSNMQQRIQKAEMLSNNSHTSTKSEQEKLSTENDLKSIQTYADLLFACYRDDYILIFHSNNFNSYTYDQMVSVRYNDTIPINCFLVYNQQLWISACYVTYIYKITMNNKKTTFDLLMKNHLDEDHVQIMLGVSDHIWAGSSRGNVYTFRTDNYERLKTFNGHKDGVCSLCSMSDTHVISGSQQFDTSIVVWENLSKDNITSTQF